MLPTSTNDYYKRLNVDRTVSSSQMIYALKNQAQIWHPDKHLLRKEESHKEFLALAEACNVLSDESLRDAYNSANPCVGVNTKKPFPTLYYNHSGNLTKLSNQKEYICKI